MKIEDVKGAIEGRITKEIRGNKLNEERLIQILAGSFVALLFGRALDDKGDIEIVLDDGTIVSSLGEPLEITMKKE